MECRKSTIGLSLPNCQVYCQPPFVVKDCCGEAKQNQSISFDGCLFKELVWLWDIGIKTTGCCCGKHIDSKINGYIQVEDEFIDKMLELGYKLDKNYKFKPCNCFIPKTIL